jgi:predicted SnoaL-like aldol condensation-catalyzing enzyme
MHTLIRTGLLCLACLAGSADPAAAQVAVTASADHERLLASKDPALAANKRLVYTFWREVFEGGRVERIDQYMAEGYIQHNPMVPTGRAAFAAFVSKQPRPAVVADRVQAPLVAITAEGDLVVLSFAREADDPSDPTKKYTTTWFDMFRIENGKIAEHWDPATRR